MSSNNFMVNLYAKKDTLNIICQGTFNIMKCFCHRETECHTEKQGASKSDVG